MASSSTKSRKEATHILQNPKEDLISTITLSRTKRSEIYLISDESDEKRINKWSHDSYQWVKKEGMAIPGKMQLCGERPTT